jgi:hypothetical protein
MIVFFTSGRGECELSGQRHKIRAGDVVIFHQETSRSYRACGRQPCPVAWIRVAEADLRPFLRHFGATVENPVLRMGSGTRLPALFEELFRAVEGTFPR